MFYFVSSSYLWNVYVCNRCHFCDIYISVRLALRSYTRNFLKHIMYILYIITSYRIGTYWVFRGWVINCFRRIINAIESICAPERERESSQNVRLRNMRPHLTPAHRRTLSLDWSGLGHGQYGKHAFIIMLADRLLHVKLFPACPYIVWRCSIADAVWRKVCVCSWRSVMQNVCFTGLCSVMEIIFACVRGGRSPV